MKILITGGHHTSALAVIDELKKKHPEAQIYFVGHT
jgi:UDP-N-acetylglucosamine:LPS N-acetylglucosamine transferase